MADSRFCKQEGRRGARSSAEVEYRGAEGVVEHGEGIDLWCIMGAFSGSVSWFKCNLIMLTLLGLLSITVLMHRSAFYVNAKLWYNSAFFGNAGLTQIFCTSVVFVFHVLGGRQARVGHAPSS